MFISEVPQNLVVLKNLDYEGNKETNKFNE